jgi:hypothetical protein
MSLLERPGLCAMMAEQLKALDGEAFRKAWQEGRDLSLEEAVADGLGRASPPA